VKAIHADWNAFENGPEYGRLGQGQRTSEGLSWSCRNKKHPACSKLKCTCKCHDENDSRAT
jgi:hypothetical protein